MIDEIKRALDGRQWPDYVIQQLGAAVGEAVAPSLRPVIGAAVAQPAAALPLGASKIGGLPHVDGAFTWPVEDDTDEPLALVCQVNLDEARKTAVSGAEEFSGMLYLFSIYDGDRAYGYEIDETTAKLLHVPAPGPLSIADRPGGLGDDGVFEERELRLGWSLVATKRFDYEVEKAVKEEISALGGVPCDVIQMLGEPRPFREENREWLAGLGDPQLLLYVNGYATQRHAFGEGDFWIVAEQADLAAAEVLFEPGT